MKPSSPVIELTKVLRSTGVRLSDEAFASLLDVASGSGPLTQAAIARALDAMTARSAGMSKTDLAARLLPGLMAARARLESKVPTSTRRALIVTALPLEYAAVVSNFESTTSEYLDGGVLLTTATSKSLPDFTVGVIQTGATNTLAAQAAGVAVAHLRPEVVLFVGVAGGLKSVALGDVVVATFVYQLGQVAEKETRNSREKAIPGSQILVQIAGRLAAQNPTIHVGPIVAGDVLLKSSTSPVADWIREHQNDALAIEMEGWGVSWSTHAAETNSVVVRGISDLLDDKAEGSDAKWQPIAAENAALIALEIVRLYASLRPEEI